MLPLALSLLKFAPSAVKLLAGDKAGVAADKIVDIAEAVTGKKGDAAVKAISQSPELALAFQQAVMAQETELQKIAAQDRQDARAHDKASYGIGFVDVIRGLVRPIIAVYFTWLIGHCIVTGISLSTEQLVMLSAPIIYYFGERGYLKNKCLKDK
jgi:hypothetical protein